MAKVNSIRILVVDDHNLVREGIKSVLKSQKKYKVSIDEAEDGLDAVRKCSVHTYDLVLMDIKMPGMDGISATREIMKKRNYPVIGLTMHSEETFASKMLEAGARGYVLKNAGSEELVKAIARVLEGGLYFSNDISIKLIERIEREKLGRKPRLIKRDDDGILSRRENEILRMIADQHTNDEIAEKLNISKRTVDTHRRNIMVKLNVKNTAGLIRCAVEMHLL